MTLTPGGGRSPSTRTPPAPPADKNEQPQPSRERRSRPGRWRALTFAVLRSSMLLGGLVIIVDLATLAMIQRTFSPEDQQAIAQADELLNWVLFSTLGIAVVRETRVFYAGILAGTLAAVVDSAVVSAAQIMAPLAGVQVSVQEVLLRNLIIGVAFAGASGIVYWLVQRSAGGTRPR